tara:strand:+ start:496 stop:606 length:111 start_codon:yes stop_codon:yes gene_type:complete
MLDLRKALNGCCQKEIKNVRLIDPAAKPLFKRAEFI